ncbi:MAG: cytidylyltransferase domain-containing protein [Candidatus Heimdallarchaeaceae archaeon]
MKIDVTAVIQARMSSSRLPGKSLAQIGEFKLIEMVLKRIQKSSMVNNIILATTNNEDDNSLVNYVEELGFNVFRGSEEDVLARVYNSVQQKKPKIIIRVTGDCPLISPKIIDIAVKRFEKESLDYLSLTIGEQLDLAYPRGFDVEVFSFEALEEAHLKASKQFEREHVTPYIYTHSEQFSILRIIPDKKYSRPKYRLCVDTEEDLRLIKEINAAFGNKMIDLKFEEIVTFLDENPEIALINQDVKQKHYTETDIS